MGLWFGPVIARCTNAVEMGVPYRGSQEVKSLLSLPLGKISGNPATISENVAS